MIVSSQRKITKMKTASTQAETQQFKKLGAAQRQSSQIKIEVINHALWI